VVFALYLFGADFHVVVHEVQVMPVVKVAQFVLLILSAPLVRGITARLKALLQRRRGASIWRPYADLLKLFRKEDIVPPSASWLFRASPRLEFAFTVAAVAFVPLVFSGGLLSFTGDFIVLVYLLAFARFLLLLGALDGGSSFGGMGASREIMISVLVEAPLLISLTAIAVTAKSASLASIVAWTQMQSFFDMSAIHMLAFAALTLVVIAETGRMPVDNPATHLELTMVHEAMVLEYSGPSLAFIELAHALKLNLMVALLIALFVPWGIAGGAGAGAVIISAAVYVIKFFVAIAALAVLESSVAKLRMYAVPEFLGIAFALSVLAIVFTVILKR
jgi:formate hydrogenlyase subunit 4